MQSGMCSISVCPKDSQLLNLLSQLSYFYLHSEMSILKMLSLRITHKDHLQVKIHRLRDTLYIQSKTLPDTIYKTHHIPIQVIRYVQPDKLDNFINKIPWIVIAFIILLGFIIFLFIRFRG